MIKNVDYQLKRYNQHTISSSSPINEGTWNIPRKMIDGKERWINTALNPEVFKYESVQQLMGKSMLDNSTLRYSNIFYS